MLNMIEEGVTFPTSYPYPVQAWRIGNELLLIGIGGEAVVDYSLRFRREFGPATWVCGYTNDMAAYIPQRRVWEEGGYEGGPHLDEYGRPAWRWAGDVEDRIAAAVHRVVRRCTPGGRGSAIASGPRLVAHRDGTLSPRRDFPRSNGVPSVACCVVAGGRAVWWRESTASCGAASLPPLPDARSAEPETPEPAAAAAVAVSASPVARLLVETSED